MNIPMLIGGTSESDTEVGGQKKEFFYLRCPWYYVAFKFCQIVILDHLEMM